MSIKVKNQSGQWVTAVNGINSIIDVDNTDFNNLMLNKFGNISNYGEFVTSLKSDKNNPDFINIGFISEISGPSFSTFSFEIKFRIDDTDSKDCAIFGSMPEFSTANFSVYTRNDLTRLNIAFGYPNASLTFVPLVEGQIYTIKIGSSSVIINDNTYAVEVTQDSTIAQYRPIFLFAGNYGLPGNSTIWRNDGTKSIYEFKIYSGETLIRHFKPYVTKTGVPCMVDIVNDNKKYFSTYGTLIAE